MEQKKKRIIVKIGSSSLTDKKGGLSTEKLHEHVEALAELTLAGHEVILVSSGAVSAGFAKLGFPSRPVTVEGKQAAAAVGQGLLIQTYSESLSRHHVTAAQILLTRADFTDRERYRNAYNTLSVLLKKGAVPIINENDTVSVNELTFGDNDMLSSLVAGLLHGDMLIILTDMDGLYDADPRRHPSANRFTYVEEITPELERMAGDTGSAVGTGGMHSKIVAVKTALSLGVPAYIGKRTHRKELLEIVEGKGKGTYFGKSSSSPLRTKKQWIAFHSEVHGRIEVDEGAAKAVLHEGKSLLPAGVVRVIGLFQPGQVVEVADSQGIVIGKGQVNYDTQQLESVKGKTTRFARTFTDTAEKIEVIHRDDWVSLVKIQEEGEK